ncbi:hypothetical protein EON65_30795 [archaeon]|nr:MAG: hypothetical protein EON65_30795 [archaeon]
MHYPHLFMLQVYDVTNEESFRHINEWLIEVSRYASENTCKLIVGNKIDLPNRVVNKEMAQAYADKMAMPLIETSAINSTNVEAAFETITKQLIESRSGGGKTATKSTSTVDKSTVRTLTATSSDKSAKKSSCC